MKCDNCSRAAIYVYGPKPLSPVHYCGQHLPSFLSAQARAGLLETTAAFDDARASALSKLSPVGAPQDPVEDAAPKTTRKKRAPRKKAESVDAPAQEPEEE